MSKIITFLTQLDLSDVEAELYLKLLSLGTTTISDLARDMGIKRTTAYLYIDSLIDKGLATRIIRGTKKFIAATDPKDLGHLIEKQRNKLDTLKKDFPEVLENIKKLFPGVEKAKDIEVRIYKGKQSARDIHEEAFNAHEVRSYARVDPHDRLYPDNAEVFKDAFKNNTKLVWWEFLYDPMSKVEISQQIEDSTDRYFYKYMPADIKLNSQDILMYDGKVALIDYRQKMTCIVLQSEDFYSILKELFDFMWKSFPNSLQK